MDFAQTVAQQILRALEHFAAGFAGEGQQQDVFCTDALFGQPGQPVYEGAGFAAACAGNDEDGAVLGGDGLELGRVESGRIKHRAPQMDWFKTAFPARAPAGRRAGNGLLQQ